jgi:hypothetical protein
MVTGVLWGMSLLAVVAASAALVIGVTLARRYRELRTALVATGVLAVPRAVTSGAPEGSFLPATGSPVSRALRVTATDGTVLTSEYFTANDVVMVFLMDQCTTCDAQLPELRATLAGLPAGGPRPVAVLSGPPSEIRHFREALEPMAHVVEDGDVKSGAGVVMAFQVHSFPTLLVLEGGVVRRAGTTAREVALETA